MQARYETLLLLNPELGSDGSNALLEKFSGVLEKNGGQVIKNDDWGLKTLAYPVKKQNRGRYIRMEYSLPAAQVSEFERNIRIADGVFKFLTVKLPQEQEKAQEEE
ncbi:30S ribosomal protein S6 [Desulfonatronospira sp. MSAO_Bac3]|uniref:30S ribosomal protein S6 n=1 Tax=Desulfonatronospira sp. MSAO_Bac3 TaxID=2293857 RepID=UPI000FF65B32|nr:30S ribosomal protein S6 [Desulfonatronospira sp. MSAO_Bac3]RQD78649.1 MAG: 30S ribosomal protein S6 [Desulfonatronospira sp. MSAO_Bac3]